MPKFAVILHRRIRYEVQADDQDDAEAATQDLYDNGETPMSDEQEHIPDTMRIE